MKKTFVNHCIKHFDSVFQGSRESADFVEFCKFEDDFVNSIGDELIESELDTVISLGKWVHFLEIVW